MKQLQSAGTAARAVVYEATGTAALRSAVEAAYRQLEQECGASVVDNGQRAALDATERMANRQSDDRGRHHGHLDLASCAAVLAAGKFQLGFDIDRLRTLTLVTLLFNGQAVFYVVRERRHLWASWPSRIVIASAIADLAIIPTMSVFGILMAPLPFSVVLGVFAAAVALALVLDQVKVATFRWLRMA